MNGIGDEVGGKRQEGTSGKRLEGDRGGRGGSRGERVGEAVRLVGREG